MTKLRRIPWLAWVILAWCAFTAPAVILGRTDRLNVWSHGFLVGCAFEAVLVAVIHDCRRPVRPSTQEDR